MHLHLDPVGGIAGDMFVASLLDVYPAFWPELEVLLATLNFPPPVAATLVPWTDGILSGSKFVVTEEPNDAHPNHRDASGIFAWLDSAPIDDAVRDRARDIFAILAEAEGRVHGVAPNDVSFHEIGAWDSIVDIVSAATVIERCGATSWSVGVLPTGSGRVPSAHGLLPVPAPAVVLLLEGFAVLDDGRPGERVTPTGAAILRHLGASVGAPTQPMIQRGVGIGFGTRRFEGLSNIVRVRALTPLAPDKPLTDEVTILEFDIDDQPAEDLAVGLDHVRATVGVLDVLQRPAFGKKGRIVVEVRVLAKPETADSVIERCFLETTTLGIRRSTVARHVLARTSHEAADVRVKVTSRPGQLRTAKAEIDDVASRDSHHERNLVRQNSERTILEQNVGMAFDDATDKP